MNPKNPDETFQVDLLTDAHGTLVIVRGRDVRCSASLNPDDPEHERLGNAVRLAFVHMERHRMQLKAN
jgi:hypothetical protein